MEFNISFLDVIATRYANRNDYRRGNYSQKLTGIPTAPTTPIGAGPRNDDKSNFYISRGKWLLVVLLLGVLQPALAQDISNIRVHLDTGQKQVVISYDLTGTGPLAGDLILQISNDQGKTWSVLPRTGSVSGDIGRGVQSGIGKRIVWQAGEDFNGLSPGDFTARLSVEKLVSSASSRQSPTEAQPTASSGEQDRENQAELDASKALPQTVSGKDGSLRLLIPAGYFTMGSLPGKGEKNEHPQHRVWVSSFYIDQKLVTFDQYDRFCDATGRKKPVDGYIQYKQQPHWGRGQRPVLSITWKEADAYCKWAGGQLPTEAEWEKAARGGTDTAYFWGKDSGKAEDYACFGDLSRHMTFPVGQFKPNGYGLYDIVGELWEWVSDWYDPQYYSESPERNPTGPDTGKLKVLRGGSFANGSDCLAVTRRNGWDPEKQDGFVELVGHVFEHGCRCAQTP